MVLEWVIILSHAGSLVFFALENSPETLVVCTEPGADESGPE